MLSKKGILQQIEQGNVLILPLDKEKLGPNTVDLTLEGYNWSLSCVLAPQFVNLCKKFMSGEKTSNTEWIYQRIGKYIGLTEMSSLPTIDPYDDYNYLIWKLQAPLDMTNIYDKKYLRTVLSERSWYLHEEMESKLIIVRPSDHLLCYGKEFVGGVNFVYGLMSCRSTVRRIGLTMCCCAGTGDVGYINRWAHEVVSTLKDRSNLMCVGNRYSQLQFPTTVEDPIIPTTTTTTTENHKQYGINEDTNNDDSTNPSKYQSIDGNTKDGLTNEAIRQLILEWNFFKFLPKKFLDREVLSYTVPQEKPKTSPKNEDKTTNKHIVSNTSELRPLLSDVSLSKTKEEPLVTPLESPSSSSSSASPPIPPFVSFTFDNIIQSSCFYPKMVIYLKYIRGALAEKSESSNVKSNVGGYPNRNDNLTGNIPTKENVQEKETLIRQRTPTNSITQTSTIPGESSQVRVVREDLRSTTTGVSNSDNKPVDKSHEVSRENLTNNKNINDKPKTDDRPFLFSTLSYLASFVVPQPDDQKYDRDIENTNNTENEPELPEPTENLDIEDDEDEDDYDYNIGETGSFFRDRYTKYPKESKMLICLRKKYSDRLISEKHYYLVKLEPDAFPLFWESDVEITLDDITKSKHGTDTTMNITNGLSSFSQFCYLATLVQYNKLNTHVAHISYMFVGLDKFLKDNTNLDLMDHNINRRNTQKTLNNDNPNTTTFVVNTPGSTSLLSQTTPTETESSNIDFYHEFDEDNVIFLDPSEGEFQRKEFVVSGTSLPIGWKVSEFSKIKKMYLYGERWSDNYGIFNTGPEYENGDWYNTYATYAYDDNNDDDPESKSQTWVKSDEAVDGSTLMHSLWREDLSINRYRSPGVMSELIKTLQEKNPKGGHSRPLLLTTTSLANYVVTDLIEDQIDDLVTFYKNMDFNSKNAPSHLSSPNYARDLLTTYFHIQAIIDMMLIYDKPHENKSTDDLFALENHQYFQKIPKVSPKTINQCIQTIQDKYTKKSFTQSTYDSIKILEDSSPVEKFYSQMVDICLEVYLFTHFVSVCDTASAEADRYKNS